MHHIQQPFTAAPRARVARQALLAVGATIALALLPERADAQTDYYNTDAGRPIQVEDAYALERRAVEIQAAPLRLERSRGGSYSWGLEPEVAVGMLPRTQVELGFPLAFVDRGAAGHSAGLAGIDLSVLHNLNAETGIPAFAIAAGVLLPVGSLAPDQAYPSLAGIATRTFSWARFHLNGRYTSGDKLSEGGGGHAGELSRWLGGIAIDRAFPLQSLLLTAELVARQPLVEQEDVRWSAAGGTRFQLSPRVATDAGAGYRLTGDDRGWYLTFGAGVSLGLPWSPRRRLP